MKKILILCLLTLSVFVTSCQNSDTAKTSTENKVDKPIEKKTTQQSFLSNKNEKKQQGTTYVISNQTNVLCQYVYGQCQPSMSGDIYPGDPLQIFVGAGDRITVTFVGRYSAPRCGHCVTKVLTGDLPSPQAINLREDTFCF